MWGEKKISQTPTLHQWFNTHARLPILLTLLSFLVVEALLLWVVTRHQFELQTGVAQRLAELSRVALEQKSTALLQASFEIASRELGATRAFVCEQNFIFAMNPPQLSSCEIHQKAGYRILQVPLHRAAFFPQKVFSFNLQVPIFPRERVFYYTLALSLGVCFLGMLLLRKIRFRLEKDIFEPFFLSFSSHLRLPVREFEELRVKLRHFNRLQTQAAVTSAVLERNAQVAHDIRSPLTALLFGLKDFESLPVGTREVMRSAVKRIASIVDSLSDHPVGLSEALREIVNEKKFEYGHQNQIHFQLKFGEISENLICVLPESEIKRILSNLMNNSVEAMAGNSGTIEVRANETPQSVMITVADEGRRIPDEVFFQMGKPGFSFGKKKGQGLGLSHAKAAIEKKGGRVLMERIDPQGLKITLEIPKNT